MTQKVKIRVLGEDDRYTQIYPETTSDQIIMGDDSGDTLNDILGDVSSLSEESKNIIDSIKEIKQYGNRVKQSMVSSLLSVDENLPISQGSTWEEIRQSASEIKVGVAVNGVIDQYKVHAGENITIGDFIQFVNGDGLNVSEKTVFSQGSNTYISATALTETKALIVYCDYRNNSYGTAVLVTFGGTGITLGSPVVFNTTYTGSIKVTTLSETKALVAYSSYLNSYYYGRALVLSIDDMTITTGTSTIFNTANIGHVSVAALNESSALILFQDYGNGYFCTAKILTIDGTSVKAGSSVVLNTANSSDTSIAVLNDSKAIVAYTNGGNGSYGQARVLLINSTTITGRGAVYFNSASTSHSSLTALTDSKVLVTYRNNGSSYRGTANVLTVDGESISSGSKFIFNPLGSAQTSATALSDSKVLVSYVNSENKDYGEAVILSVNDTEITKESTTIFNQAGTSNMTSTVLPNSKVLVAYTDQGNISYGTCNLLTLNETTVKKANSKYSIGGISNQNGSNGEMIEIYTI